MAIRPARLAVTTLGALVLAGLLFVQAGSSVLMRKQPELAARLMPINGLALEQAATRQFQAGVQTQDDIGPAAKEALSTAMRAYSHDPLNPKSLAIMALAEDDQATKRRVLDAASKLNRRDLLLQGLILDDQVARGDYAQTLSTLDNMLRVHPEQKATIFPILTEALKDDSAAAQLGAILDRSAPWHEQFLNSAAADREALPNLARLRLGRDDVDPDVDRQLIRGLVASGRTDLAFPIYAAAKPAGDGSPGSTQQRLGWNSDFPPFDWSLANEGGFRADYLPEEAHLEIYVRSGKGGILAERLVEAPPTPFAIAVSHTLTPADQVKDLRLQVGCPGAEEPVVDQPLSVRPGEVRIPAMAGRCEFMKVALYGRSWSGKSAIRGQIVPLIIRPE